jgi:hypothetical protein
MLGGAGTEVVGGGPSSPGSWAPIGTEIPTVPSTVEATFWAGSGNAPADASPPVRGSAQTATAVAARAATREKGRREGRTGRVSRSSMTAAAICSTACRSPANSRLVGASRSACNARATRVVASPVMGQFAPGMRKVGRPGSRWPPAFPFPRALEQGGLGARECGDVRMTTGHAEPLRGVRAEDAAGQARPSSS